jgi:hypothetical protein
MVADKGETIARYREAKSTYLKLQSQAKKELIDRFRELSAELLQIQKELREDFGHKVTIPTKSRNMRPKKVPAVKPVKPATASPAVARIEKKLATQRAKLEASRATGKATKPIEDRLYELEDELRFARQP